VFLTREVILHIDMDAFFTSCEELKNKNLKNKIFVVATRTKHSVVASANYKARALGIKAGMPLFKAKEKLSNLLIIESDLNFYQNMSSQIFTFIKKRYSQKIEVTSIDECYLNVTNNYSTFGTVTNLINNIQKNIWIKFKLTCSIGASFSKFFAKIAANINKPNNFFIINENNYKFKLDNFSINIIPGIGQVAYSKLFALNIKTIKEFKDYLLHNYHNVNNVFNSKIIALGFLNELLGRSNLNINLNKIQKSISIEKTFVNSLGNLNIIYFQFQILVKKLFLEVKSKGFIFSTLKIKLKDTNFCNYLFQIKLKNNNNKFNYVFSKLQLLVKTKWNKKPLRLIGVCFANLQFSFNLYLQKRIFDDNSWKSNLKTIINKKYQTKIIL